MSNSGIDAVKLSQDLIRCPSVTPKDEGAQAVLIEALTPLGFKCHTLHFEDIINLYARLGTEGPHFCYAGHTDVVPTGDEKSWTYPPFAAEIHNGKLYGRGSSDMKCNNACFVSAVSRFIGKHGEPKGSISFLITGDEEGEAINGTVKVLEWMKEHDHIPDICLVGEPTNPAKLGDEIKVGRRGSLNATLTVTGTQGHVAYQHLADNPIPRLTKLLNALTDFEFDQGAEFFPPTNLEITTIDTGNKADNVIPEKTRADFNVRFNDHWNAKTLSEKIREIMNKVTNRYEIEFSSNAESFITKPGPLTDLVANAVEEKTGIRPGLSTKGGTSDARFITNYCPVVEFGLINETVHQIDEYAAIEDIESLTDIYLGILENYFLNA